MHIDFKSFRNPNPSDRRTLDSTRPKMDQGQHRLDPSLLEQPPRRRNHRLNTPPAIPDHETITDFSEWILWPGIVFRVRKHVKHPNPNHIKVYTDQKGKYTHIGWASHHTYWSPYWKYHTSCYYIYIHIPTIKYHTIRQEDLYLCNINPIANKDYLLISILNTEANNGSIMRQITFPEKKLPLLAKNNGTGIPPHRP